MPAFNLNAFESAPMDAHNGRYAMRDGVLTIDCDDWAAAQKLRRSRVMQDLGTAWKAHLVRLMIGGVAYYAETVSSPSQSETSSLSVNVRSVI